MTRLVAAAAALLFAGCFTAAGAYAGAKGGDDSDVVTGVIAGATLDVLFVLASTQLEEEKEDPCQRFGPRIDEHRCQ
jgi:heme/copper-type cytochrome/quinol oxidase subunit 3